MIKIERKKRILKYLEINQTLSISTIAKELKCSEETARKDLIELEKESKLVRTHGGAYTEGKYSTGFSLEMREILLKKEKEYMADIALSFIKDKNMVMLDGSTTSIELVKKIINSNKIVTIITNSLQIASLCSIAENIKLILIGGKLNKKNKTFVGYNATDIISVYNADISFLSYPCIDKEFGLGDNSLEELHVRDSMQKHSKKRILLMDHTKFTENDSLFFSKIRDIDSIITDRKPTADWDFYLRNSKIKLKFKIK